MDWLDEPAGNWVLFVLLATIFVMAWFMSKDDLDE